MLPEDFDFFGDDREFFAPLCLTRAQVESRVGANTIVGRLKPGVSIEQAQAELDALTLAPRGERSRSPPGTRLPRRIAEAIGRAHAERSTVSRRATTARR